MWWLSLKNSHEAFKLYLALPIIIMLGYISYHILSPIFILLRILEIIPIYPLSYVPLDISPIFLLSSGAKDNYRIGYTPGVNQSSIVETIWGGSLHTKKNYICTLLLYPALLCLPISCLAVSHYFVWHKNMSPNTDQWLAKPASLVGSIEYCSLAGVWWAV